MKALGYFSTESPLLEPIPCSKFSRVIQPLRHPYYFVSANREYIITCPHRMKTDGGSIPWFVALGQLDARVFIASYIGHDSLFYFRTALRRREWRDALTETERHILCEGVRESYEPLRNYIWGKAFDVVPVGLHWANDCLDEMISAQTEGDARLSRAIIRAGLFFGSWVPWLSYGARKRRNESRPDDPIDYETVTA